MSRSTKELIGILEDNEGALSMNDEENMISLSSLDLLINLVLVCSCNETNVSSDNNNIEIC